MNHKNDDCGQGRKPITSASILASDSKLALSIVSKEYINT